MHELTPTPSCYNAYTQRWELLEREPSPTQPYAQLSIATLNVWFGAAHFAERCAATLRLLGELQPDIITLQEVTIPFLDALRVEPWVQAEYRLSDSTGESVDPYGVLILSRIPITEWVIWRLPSAMGRHLVTVQTILNGQPFVCASVHLESQSYSAPIRTKQLSRIFPYLAEHPQLVFTGDFNIDAASAENEQIDPSYLDLWPYLHPFEDGYTVDTERNTMRWIHKQKPKRVRFDRMLLRSANQLWQPESIELIGDTPIDPATPAVFPSDHFGLIARLQWNSSAT
jgi:tyrosyl-DNA phosphodiesterase 2